MKQPILTAAILILMVQTAFLQHSDNNFPPPEEPLEIVVKKVSTKIQIDGKLDESDWELAAPVSDFFPIS